MTDIIVVLFFIATIVGFKNPIYGSIAGLVLSIGYCYFKADIDLYAWVLIPIFGALFGYLFPLSARWLFSALRGGRGETEPGTTYIGGFGLGRAGQFFGKWSEGIIPTKNEETGWLEDKEEGRERNIGILVRYLFAPIVIILVFAAYLLLT